jgi:hypothetical protein
LFRAGGDAMVEETKFFRKQAAKAERMARSASDAEMSERFLNMAKAYRSQADVLKAKKKSSGRRRARSKDREHYRAERRISQPVSDSAPTFTRHTGRRSAGELDRNCC